MILEDNKEDKKILVDLKSPAGNAFALIGLAQDLCRKTGLSSHETEEMIDDMQSGDFENLIQILDGVFGDLIILQR